MSTTRITHPLPSIGTLLQRALRALRRHYVAQRIRWAEQDLRHMEHERELLPQRIDLYAQWLQAQRVELAVLEQQP